MTKLVLKKYEETEKLFDKAIAGFGDKVPAAIWGKAAYTKGKLEKWDEAENLCGRAINGRNEGVPEYLLDLAAEIKSMQRNTIDSAE